MNSTGGIHLDSVFKRRVSVIKSSILTKNMSNGMKRVLALLYFGVLAMGSIYAQGIEFFMAPMRKHFRKPGRKGSKSL